MRNIILIGMPGSGKTTFGKAIAERLGRPFIDADDYLEEKEGRTIASSSPFPKTPSAMPKKEPSVTFPKRKTSS